MLILITTSCSSYVSNEKKALKEAKKIAKLSFDRNIFILDSLKGQYIRGYYLTKLPDSFYTKIWSSKNRLKQLEYFMREWDNPGSEYFLNEENINSYKRQLKDFDLYFLTSKLETSKAKISPYKNNNREDYLRFQKESSGENYNFVTLSSPVFTSDGEYALFFESTTEVWPLLAIYKKERKSWKPYRYIQYPLTDIDMMD